MNLEAFLIFEHAPLREALSKIEANQHGIILTVNDSGVVVGFGDGRRTFGDGYLKARL